MVGRRGNQKTLLMGVGGVGMNITRCIAEHVDYPVVGVDTDAEAVAAWNNADVVLLGAGLCGGMPAQLPAVAGLAVEQSHWRFRSLLADYCRLVVIAGLGDGTGMGATPVIAELARAMGVETLAAVVLPAVAGDQACRAAALRTMEGLRSLADEIRVYDSEQDLYAKDYGQSSATGFFARQARDIAADLHDYLSCGGSAVS